MRDDATSRAVLTTDLDLPERRAGKVRDTYRLGDDEMLLVATDRISAFDVVLPSAIPGKGVLLTEMAAFWLRFVERTGLIGTHLRTTDLDSIPDSAFKGETAPEDLAGRSMIGRRCRVLPVEFVVRGYLEGSGWADYQATGEVCGVSLPTGLERCARLPEPIFTPATKAAVGEHDENVSVEVAGASIGRELLDRLADVSIEIYRRAAAYSMERGIIIADTKFEFGIPIDERGQDVGEPVLIDEALTPDSSRFWPAANYEPGRPQPSFDKQFVREHLERLVDQGLWDKTSPGPALPLDVIEGTLARYREARDRLLT
jgi:phosphoribosylaminoimidazole-succinocarboxamide synthase